MSPPLVPVTVIKRDHRGQRLLSYQGQLLARGPTWLCLEARFTFPDHDAGYHVFRRGDRFVEWFYTDRGYNIFALHAADDDRLQGWYCNITRPARIDAPDSDPAGGLIVEADDLALDVFVRPDGTALVLDEDEFSALDLPADDRAAALAALADLRAHIAAGRPPFDER